MAKLKSIASRFSIPTLMPYRVKSKTKHCSCTSFVSLRSALFVLFFSGFQFALAVSSTLLINGAMGVMIGIMYSDHVNKWRDFRKKLIETIALQDDYITKLRTVSTSLMVAVHV